ncbi:lysylphosphatidylglycerol synthase transmembrane domain-containing protein [soil metagenome]
MVATTGRSGADVVDARPGADPALDDDLLSGPSWSRHPIDRVRLGLALLALAVTLGMSLRQPIGVRSVTVDLVETVNQLPWWLRQMLLGTTQVFALVVSIALVVFVARRPKLLAVALAATVVAAGVMAVIQGWVDDAVPNRMSQVAERPSWITGAAFPSGTYLAGFTAALVVIGPVLSRGWRRVTLVSLVIAVLTRVITAVAVPLNLAITLALGAAVGSVALIAVGSPRRSASRRAVLAGLASAGFPAERIEPAPVGAGHAKTYVAATASGRRAFVKLLGRDERDAYLIQRVYKALRVKDLDDLRPAWSPVELAEHEAYTTLLAARPGAVVPQVLAAGSTRGGDGILALVPLDGDRLGGLRPVEVTDEVLDEVWDQVVRLHGQGIAHRWLTARHLMVGRHARSTDGEDNQPHVTLCDLRWAVHQADPNLLAADVAMLVTSLALIVGADRSVGAAARALPPQALADALPLVQPLAMPADVQAAVADQRHVLNAVRGRLQAAAGDVDYELADIERVKLSSLFGLAVGVILAYAALSFASSWAEISQALATVSLWSLPVLILLGSVQYVSGAATFMSVVPRRLPYFEVVRLMIGQSFLNRFTPANAGGMALRIRYLQQYGVGLGGAAAGVALTSVSSGVAQVGVLLTFAAWAGSSTTGLRFELPEASEAAVVIAGVTLVAGLVWLTPWGRHVVGRRVETTMKQVWTTLRDLSRQPARFIALFGTTLLSKAAMIVAFTESSRAVDISISFPRLGLLYMTASSLAAAAPTPGSVGAVEAALTAALTGVGVPLPQALSAVFLFRLVTYWLPVPFGWWSLRRLRQTIFRSEPTAPGSGIDGGARATVLATGASPR